MDVRTMENILNFKEGEGQVFIECHVVKKDDDSGIAFDFKLDTDFNEIYRNDVGTLTALATLSYQLYYDEIHKELSENEEVPILSVSVIAGKEENETSIYLNYAGIYKKGYEELIKSAQEVNERLSQNLTRILDQFANAEENIKPFELIFKKQDGGYRFCDFCRLADREIRQQKLEIRELMSRGFEKKLLDKAEEIGYNLSEMENNEIVMAFSTDNKEIYGLKIGTFPNSK